MTKRLILVVGASTCGKTSCLEGLENHEKVLYLNCESGKGLPFRNKFIKQVITEPMREILGAGSYLEQAAKHPEMCDTIVIDSLTLLMEQFETRYVKTAPDTRAAWGSYGDFFKTLLNQVIPTIPQSVILTAHTSEVYNDKESVVETKVKLKGSIMNVGVEAYFNDVVACKKMAIKDLEPYQSDLLHITEEDRDIGYKHVIQTRLTKETKNERIRANKDMWARNETYIDGNIQLVLNRLNEYYGD